MLTILLSNISGDKNKVIINVIPSIASISSKLCLYCLYSSNMAIKTMTQAELNKMSAILSPVRKVKTKPLPIATIRNVNCRKTDDLKSGIKKAANKAINHSLSNIVPGIGLRNGPVKRVSEKRSIPNQSTSKKYCHNVSAIISSIVSNKLIRKRCLFLASLKTQYDKATANKGHLIKVSTYFKLSDESLLKGRLTTRR